jgi:hypothetical protein
MKKVFIISAVSLAVVLLVLGVYNFGFKVLESKPKPVVQQVEQAAVVTTEMLAKKTEKITLVSKEPVVGAVADKKTEKVFYYSASDGTIWQVDGEGLNRIQISDAKIAGLVNASWSPDRLKSLTVIEQAGKKSFFLYDNVKKDSISLKEGLDNVIWDSLGAKIIYKYYDSKSKKRSLSIADPDGRNWVTLVADLPFRNLLAVAIPSTSIISFWNFPNSNEETDLQIISATGGQVKSILKGKFGGDYLWSPDGSQALVSSLVSKESKIMTLGVVNMQGQYRDLGIPTMVSKCVWSVDSKTLYCALPGAIPAGAIMPNDYQDKKFLTQDTFWKINIATGSKERVVELIDIQGAFDVSNLFLSATEDSLFFINQVDRKLYRIAL